MINLYIDLDDTLFQTKYKNPDALFQATIPASGRIDSYMSVAQLCWQDVWLARDDTRFIPITARSLSQYQRTCLSQNPKIELAATYFSGQILLRGQVDGAWQALWREQMLGLSVSVAAVYAEVLAVVERQNQGYFRVFDVDGFYVTVKADRACPLAVREACFEQLRQLDLDGYVVHENARAFSWLPAFLNKKQAVAYLKQHYPADLHLGMGDSHSDWDFMQLCDFQVLPQASQLNAILSAQF